METRVKITSFLSFLFFSAFQLGLLSYIHTYVAASSTGIDYVAN